MDDALNVCSLGNGFGRFDEFYRVEGALKVGGRERTRPLSGAIERRYNRENGSSLSAIFPRRRLRQKAGRVNTSLILSWKQTAWRRCDAKSRVHRGPFWCHLCSPNKRPDQSPLPPQRGDLHRESRSLTNIFHVYLA